jgi:cytochrome P450
VQVPAGEKLYVSILSANRDPSQFENPDEFDITRKPGGHVGFGHGIHYCLGAPLARLETQIVLRELLDRFPALRLAVDPDTLSYRKSSLMHSPATLPVCLRWPPRSRGAIARRAPHDHGKARA